MDAAKRHERCIHNMVKATCANCCPPRAPAVPAKRRETAHSAGNVSAARTDALGLVIVHTNHGKDQVIQHGLDGVDETTVTVHIHGHPFLWAFEEILKRAPRLKTIQVIPSILAKCHPDSHHRLCKDRGVEIKAGHVRPDLVWEEDRICSKNFEGQHRFMATLVDPQRSLFEELGTLGFEAAAIAKRYYGVGGEERTTQRLLAQEYGYGCHNSSISALVLAVLYYLDDTTEVGEVSKRRALAMRNKVERLRGYVASVEGRARLLKELAAIGVANLADDFPLARIDVLKALLAAQRNGNLAALAKRDPRAHQVVTLRFGFDGRPGETYRILDTVGQMIGGVTRERARQLEERALRALNILED
jgi:hypothetical protein